MDWLTFIALKLNISFILHVLRFEGIISAIKLVYDFEVLVHIDIACSRVSKLDLSSSSQQCGPHFPYFATRPCTAAEVIPVYFRSGLTRHIQCSADKDVHIR